MEFNKDEATRTQYEYQKIYLNQNLIYPNCWLPFFVTEKPAPLSGKIPNSPFPWFVQHQRQGMFARSGGIESAIVSASGTTQTAPQIQPADESLKRRHEKH
ncbi:uncharacterized protein Fot_44054 [Forsythia ovata]|uniref:Uncharacterized protein n=1 Tax=Forsythia ovata TaxID=205694 RepID=A0ABD1R2E6_9LAMI